MRTSFPQGLLITFEGIDGSGKTSAAHALYAYLKDKRPTVLTREPGGSEYGKTLRTLLQGRTFALDPKAEFLLFASDRAQHMQEVVLPALEQGNIVISDRMGDSSYAYQGYGRGVHPAMIHEVNSWAMQGREPDLTLYVMISFAEAKRRLGVRNERATVFEQEQEAFFERVVQGFEAAFAQRSPEHLVMRFDGHQTQEKLHVEIIRQVKEYIRQRGLI
jgi:dTMP kinase